MTICDYGFPNIDYGFPNINPEVKKMTIIETNGTTAQSRKFLRNQARKGKIEVVLVSKKGGSNARLGVRSENTIRVISPSFPRQFRALQWLLQKIGNIRPAVVYEVLRPAA